ncbi:hypothetical protein, partial [Vibrio sp. 10N.222.49.C9]
ISYCDGTLESPKGYRLGVAAVYQEPAEGFGYLRRSSGKGWFHFVEPAGRFSLKRLDALENYFAEDSYESDAKVIAGMLKACGVGSTVQLLNGYSPMPFHIAKAIKAELGIEDSEVDVC